MATLKALIQEGHRLLESFKGYDYLRSGKKLKIELSKDNPHHNPKHPDPLNPPTVSKVAYTPHGSYFQHKSKGPVSYNPDVNAPGRREEPQKDLKNWLRAKKHHLAMHKKYVEPELPSHARRVQALTRP